MQVFFSGAPRSEQMGRTATTGTLALDGLGGDLGFAGGGKDALF